jgi:PTS system ascorbate-specific IIA component
MSVGLLIVTHNRIGAELLQTATSILGSCPLNARTLEVRVDCDRDRIQKQARALIGELDEGDGVLVLTDIYGATPSNIASDLASTGSVELVSGINLPMVLRVFNYASLSLAEITQKAVSGGQEGVFPQGNDPSLQQERGSRP